MALNGQGLLAAVYFKSDFVEVEICSGCNVSNILCTRLLSPRRLLDESHIFTHYAPV